MEILGVSGFQVGPFGMRFHVCLGKRILLGSMFSFCPARDGGLV